MQFDNVHQAMIIELHFESGLRPGAYSERSAFGLR